MTPTTQPNGFVTQLKHNQVFVFGSNLDGNHAGGAARQALEFGAKPGIGVGLAGQTYAIPTMHGHDRLYHYAQEFMHFASHHPDVEFLLTPVGTGIAGFPVEDIELAFNGLPDNVIKVGW